MGKNRYNKQQDTVEQPEVESTETQQEEVVEEVVTEEQVNENTETTVSNDDQTDAIEENSDEEQLGNQDTVEQPEVESTETQQEEVVEESKVELDGNAIAKLLAQPGIKIVDKLETIRTQGTVPYKMLMTKLFGYNDLMSPNAPSLEPVKGAGRNFDLYTVLKSVVSEEDYTVFKVKFDLVNMVFKTLKGEAYNEYMLHRHDQQWKWGKETLTTYQHLVTIISSLCDMSTRAHSLKHLSLDKALDKNVIVLSDKAIDNITKYYKS